MRSQGNTKTNPPGPAAPLGVVEIRLMAAKGLESGMSSGGNAESVADPPSAPAGHKTKPTISKRPDATMVKGGGKENVEGVPPFAKESLSGDGWTRAQMRAREMFASKK